ncbi:MAG: hypothetical protein ACRCWF_08870 [Beijerinckiaceae bacterium]
MIKTLLAGVVAASALTMVLPAPAEARSGTNRFHIVDGDQGRVVYDDGRNDGGCIFRRKFVGYDYWGNPRFRKVFHCY